MKIALVSPYDFAYPGGVAGHISHLDKHFRRRGHDVKILAPSSESAEALGQENLIAIGRPIPVPGSGSLARITLSVRLTPKVRAVLDQERFDIAHIHEPLMPVLPLTVLRIAQCTKVGTFHAFADSKRAYRYSRFLLNRWIERLDGRIAVSQPAKDFVSRYFPGDYEIIPNGIDVQHFATPQPPLEAYRDGKLNILFVGRISEKRKGLRYLLRAYSRLKWEFPECRLLVVGPGEPDEESARIIAERGLRDVEVLGRVSSDTLAAAYQVADVFCSPATGAESFGLVLLEAMAAGKPVVASNIAGYASVVEEGVEGLLVDPKNEETFAASLLSLLQNTDRRLRMGDRGRIKARRFAWENIAERVLAHYERLLEARARRYTLLPHRAVS